MTLSTLQRLFAACSTVVLLCLGGLYAGMAAGGQAGPQRSDFLPSYAAGRMILQGHGGALYDLLRLGYLEARLVQPLHVRDGVMPYLYPPHVALLMSPLSELPYSAAFLVWLALNLLLLATTVLWLFDYLRLHSAGRYLAAIGLASFLPVLVTLAQGQVSLLLLAAAASALWALHRRQNVCAGCLLGLLAIKPTYLLPVLVVLAVGARWRVLAAAAASISAALGLAAAALGTHAVLRYAETLVSAAHWRNQIGGFQIQWTESLASLTDRAGNSVLAVALLAGLVLPLLVLLVLCARREHGIDVPFAGAIGVGLLASPHVLIHDLSLLAVPAAVLWRIARPALHWKVITIAGAYLTLLVGLPLQSVMPVAPAGVATAAVTLLLLNPRALPVRQAHDAIERVPAPSSVPARHTAPSAVASRS